MSQARVIPKDTLKRQAKASDPRNSVWVSANAGSGKTHVLAQRVIRLLLEGTHPSRILCLTYTRAAAANMSNRVFGILAKWTALGEAELAREIAALDSGRSPDGKRLARARRLFAEALETPGGLKIQTIHAFCEAVLHQFPLEANIVAHFELLDSQMEAALVAEARRDMLTGIVGSENPRLAEAFATVLQAGGEFGLDLLLSEIVAQRDRLRRFIDQVGGHDPDFGDLWREFGFVPGERPEELAGSLWPDRYFDLAFAESFGRCAAGRANAGKFADALVFACGQADPVRRLEALREAFCTRKGSDWQARSVKSIGMAAQFPEFPAEFQRFSEAVLALSDRVALARMLDGTRAALTLADRLIERYEQLKSGRGFLDFNDLIARTARLLQRQDAGPWVQYKLDRGIDHILIDEAQDTSPDQWSVVRQLAAEFFSGLSARDDVLRTIFAVGDEKQSIYSFQGAAPESFAETGVEFRTRVKAAARKFQDVQLPWSFRSTADVLEAVDRVFRDRAARRGLTHHEQDGPPTHKPTRVNAAGHVEIWPFIGATAVEEPEDWTRAIDHAKAPAVQLANAIALKIRGWLDGCEMIEGQGRPLTAGDVMVLVRKRDRFVHALSRRLKELGVPVAGADRLSLPAHIAVRDLAALGRVLVQPEDDLCLASVLKSPIFGFPEEELMELALGRPAGQSLLARLRERGDADPELRAAADQLEAWTNEAAFRPVFEFFATLLSRDRVRARMTARLGAEAGDILDEFLSFCLAEERAGLPGMEAFLATLDSAGPEIKREMDQARREVRIMTVHAAKGLEAPVVFLVDGGSAPFDEQHMPRLLAFESRKGLWRGPGLLWRSAAEIANGQSREAAARFRARADDEYRRLLYVGMTRAEDRLIVCGYYGQRQPQNSWHAIVSRGLCGCDETRQLPDPVVPGGELRRFRVSPEALPLAARPVPPKLEVVKPAPDWVAAVLPPAEPQPRTLAPSGAVSLIEPPPLAVANSRSPVLDEEDERGFAARRGTVIHKLLQMLPDLPPDTREAAARRYLARAGTGAGWDDAAREAALACVRGIVAEPRFAPVFAPGSRAEVAVTGTLRLRGGPRVVSGKIDRLAVTGEGVLIVDYKTNRPAPQSLEEVPEAYVMQLALYRALLAGVYPGQTVSAGLLFTEAPRLLELPADLLDPALARLGGGMG